MHAIDSSLCRLGLEMISLKYLLSHLGGHEFDRCFSPWSEHRSETLNWINSFILKTIHINGFTGPENQMQILFECFCNENKTSLRCFFLSFFFIHFLGQMLNQVVLLHHSRYLPLTVSQVHQTCLFITTGPVQTSYRVSGTRVAEKAGTETSGAAKHREAVSARSHPAAGRSGW